MKMTAGDANVPLSCPPAAVSGFIAVLEAEALNITPQSDPRNLT